MAKNKSLWQSIKDWFTGGSSKSNNTSTNKSVTKGSGYSATSDSIKQAYAERERNKKEQEEAQRQAWQKAEEERKAKNEERAKQAIQAKQGGNSTEANNIKSALKSYSDTVNTEAKKMNVAPQVAQQLGSNRIKAQDIKSSYKAMPMTTAFSEGAVRGATMGLSDIATRNTKGDVRKALNNAHNNYTTGQNVARIGGELAGSMVTFGGTSGLSEKIGNKAISSLGGSEAKAVEKLANSNFIKNYASKLSKKAGQEITSNALAKSFVKELSTDLGMELGVGNIMDLTNAIETDGDLKDKLGNYVSSKVINTIIGAPINKIQAGKGAINAGRKALAEELGYSYSHPYSEVLGLTPNVRASKNRNASLQVEVKPNSVTDADLKSYGVVKVDTNRLIADVNDTSSLTYDKNYADFVNKALKDPKLKGKEVYASEDYSEFFSKEEAQKSLADHLNAYIKENDIKGKTLKNGKREWSFDSEVPKLNRNSNNAIDSLEAKSIAEEKSIKKSPESSIDALNNGKQIVFWDGDKNITINKVDGKYEFFVSGEGEKLLNEKDAKSLISKLKKLEDEAIALEDEYIKNSRVSKLTDAENARIKELQDDYDKIGKLYAEEARKFKESGYKNQDKYNQIASAYGSAQTNIKREINAIRDYEAGKKNHYGIDTSKYSIPNEPKISLEPKDIIKQEPEVKAELPETNANNVYGQSKGGKAMRKELSKMQEEAKLGDGGSIGEGEFKDTVKTDYQDIKPSNVDDVTKMNERYETEKLLSTEKGKDEYMSRSAVTDLRSATNDTERQIIQETADLGLYNHKVEHNMENTEKAVKRLAENPNKVFKRIKDYVSGTTDIASKDMLEAEYDMYATVSYVGKKLDDLEKTGLSDSIEYTTWRQLFEDTLKGLHDISTIAGQVQQVRGAMVRCTPEGRVSIATRDAVNLIYKSSKWRNAYGKELGITIDKTNAKQFAEQYINSIPELKEAFNNVEKAYTEEASQKAFFEFYKAVNEYVPNTVLDYALEWRYVSMLLNIPTHERNLISNIVFAPIRDATNTLAYAMEKAGKALGVIEKEQAFTHGLVSPKTTVEALSKNPKSEYGKLANETLDVSKLKGYDTKFESIGLTDKENRKLKFVGKISKFNSWLLEKVDEFFLRTSYKKNFISLCKVNKLGTEQQVIKDTEKLKKLIEQQAINEARISTFREYNAVANWLNKQTKGLNDADTKKWAKAGAVILNANFPFPKTTANIGKQLVRYTPEGIIEGVVRLAKAGKNGSPQEVSKALDALCSGAVGTSIIGLGYVAKKTTGDIFHAQFDNDDEAGKYQKNLGVQDFSMTINGKNYALSSISPSSAPFFLGVRLAEITEKAQKESATMYDKFENIEEVLSSLVSVGVEQSMLASINYQLESLTRDTDTSTMPLATITENLAWSYIGSFIPSMQGKIAKSLYETDKQLPKTSSEEYQVNNLRYKMGLAGTNILGEKLGAKTDVHGNLINDVNELGFARKFARNMLSPFSIKDVNISEGDKALVDTYYQAIAEGLDPKDENLYQLFSYVQSKKEQKVGKKESGKVDLNMSNLDLAEYNKARAKSGKEIVTAAVKTEVFDGLSNSQKKALIENAPESGQDALTMLTQTDEYKNASVSARKNMSKAMWTGNSKSQGYKKAGQLAAWENQGKDKYDYLFLNDISAERQNRYNESYKNVVSKQKMVEFNEGAISNKGSFTVESMYSFLNSTNWTEEEKAACFNTFKSTKTKAYSSAKASQYGVGNDPWADVDDSSSSSSSSSSLSSSSSSKTSSDKSKAPDMGSTRTKSKYKDVGSAVKKNKSVKNVVELKSNYSSKLKPPTAKW